MASVQDRPIKVYLFATRAAYEAYDVATYARKPTTPYGFYRGEDRRMVMNVSTGRGPSPTRWSTPSWATTSRRASGSAGTPVPRGRSSAWVPGPPGTRSLLDVADHLGDLRERIDGLKAKAGEGGD